MADGHLQGEPFVFFLFHRGHWAFRRQHDDISRRRFLHGGLRLHLRPGSSRAWIAPTDGDHARKGNLGRQILRFDGVALLLLYFGNALRFRDAGVEDGSLNCSALLDVAAGRFGRRARWQFLAVNRRCEEDHTPDETARFAHGSTSGLKAGEDIVFIGNAAWKHGREREEGSAACGDAGRTIAITYLEHPGSARPAGERGIRFIASSASTRETINPGLAEVFMHPAAPRRRSFVPVPPPSHFSLENLPYGVCRRRNGPRCIAVALGECVVDLTALEALGLLDLPVLQGQRVFQSATLNAFMAQKRAVWSAMRARVRQLLDADEPTLRDNAELLAHVLVPKDEVEMLLPADIGDYTDFYSSREHATNVGTMFRGAEKALQPNWLHLPVAYHGRASSIIVSGTNVRRPWGQSKPDDATPPIFGPSRSLDFELEMAAFVGSGNALGQPIPLAEAENHLFGMVLLNDWSARDIQAWEYVPLGPFLGKNFATSISPWIVPMEALEPFRVPAPPQEPTPLPYLHSPTRTTYDIHLEVSLRGEKMSTSMRVCASNFRHLYWTLAQQVAHHTVNGCNLRPGDLLASGTISGPTPDSYGSLLELTWRGSRPLPVGDETRTFLRDGDCVTMTAWCQGEGFRVGFGSVSATILPAQQ